MTSSMSMFAKMAVASVFVVAAAASQAATVTTYRVTGTVQQVDTANNQVILAQDSVTELGWPVRVMSYKVNGNTALKDLAAGQKVRATFTAESNYQPVLRSVYIDKK